MAFFKETFLADMRSNLLQSLGSVEYQLNQGDWNSGTVNKKEISGTEVVLYVNVPCSGEADTVTGVRIYDSNGDLAGEQTINLSRGSDQGALLRISCPLIETT